MVTDYPPDEHVYRHALRAGDYDAAQLIHELEDGLGLLLSQYPGQETTDGWATIDNLVPQFDLRTFAPLTESQLALVKHVVAQHHPRPLAYGGPFGRIATRYAGSVGRVLVEHSETRAEHSASGFVFGQSDRFVTAAHVVRKPWRLLGVEFGGHSVAGSVMHSDDALDVALVRLDEKCPTPPLPIRRPLTLNADLGQLCLAVGYPNVPGTHPALSMREVRLTAIRHSYLADQDLIELSEHLLAGFSGGPVLTAGSSVTGMIVGFPSAESSTEATVPVTRGAALCLPDAALITWFRRVTEGQ